MMTVLTNGVEMQILDRRAGTVASPWAVFQKDRVTPSARTNPEMQLQSRAQRQSSPRGKAKSWHAQNSNPLNFPGNISPDPLTPDKSEAAGLTNQFSR